MQTIYLTTFLTQAFTLCFGYTTAYCLIFRSCKRNLWNNSYIKKKRKPWKEDFGSISSELAGPNILQITKKLSIQWHTFAPQSKPNCGPIKMWIEFTCKWQILYACLYSESDSLMVHEREGKRNWWLVTINILLSEVVLHKHTRHHAPIHIQISQNTDISTSQLQEMLKVQENTNETEACPVKQHPSSSVICWYSPEHSCLSS